MVNAIDTLLVRKHGAATHRLWVTVLLSLLMHLAVLRSFPDSMMPRPGSDTGPGSPAVLTLRLMPPIPPALPAPPDAAPARTAPRTPQRPAAPRDPPAPPVIALNRPAPAAPAPPSAVTLAPAPVTGDFAALVEARRRARGTPEPVPQSEDDNARRDRIIAGNLATQRNVTFGYDANQGGGVFQIEQIGYDYAEFVFYGWNRDIRRNTKQLIEVRKGEHADIRTAVVRRMVAIIREYEEEDFLWVSQRLGRNVMLSARSRDRAGLEDFMMREFFPAPAPAQR